MEDDLGNSPNPLPPIRSGRPPRISSGEENTSMFLLSPPRPARSDAMHDLKARLQKFINAPTISAKLNAPSNGVKSFQKKSGRESFSTRFGNVRDEQ
eukprot:8467627-Pyramimonas_sp.AAC.2